MTSSHRRRSLILWVLAIIITLGSVAYQRATGPTHPVRGKVKIGEEVLAYKLIRSQEVTSDAMMQFHILDPLVTGEMRWKRYRSNDDWTTQPLERQGDFLVARIPRQPAAGKVIYEITIIDGVGQRFLLCEEPVIIRFKGPVPKAILLPHILFMFSAMLVSTRAGLEAITKGGKAYMFAVWTACLLFLGGIIFGPIVQNYAFGEYWTGWPFGHDLTDNKTALALLLWLIALWRGRRHRHGRGWIITASVVQLLVYLIPHSVLGSELDYTKME